MLEGSVIEGNMAADAPSKLQRVSNVRIGMASGLGAILRLEELRPRVIKVS